MSVVTFGPHHVDDTSTLLALTHTPEWIFIKEQHVDEQECVRRMNEMLQAVLSVTDSNIPRKRRMNEMRQAVSSVTDSNIARKRRMDGMIQAVSSVTDSNIARKEAVQETAIRAAHILCLLFTRCAPPADHAERVDLAKTVYNIAVRLTDDVSEQTIHTDVEDLILKEESVIQTVSGSICDPTPYHFACVFIRNSVKDELHRTMHIRDALERLSNACGDIRNLVPGPEAVGRVAASDEERFPDFTPRFRDGHPYVRVALKKYTDLYTKEKELGTGAYGKVFKARKGAEEVAIKVVPLPGNVEYGHESSTLCEWGILTLVDRAKSDHIVRLLGVFRDPEEGGLGFALEYCDTTLDEIIKRPDTSLSEFEILRFATHLFSGLAAMHSLGVVHRDLKPHNLLVKNGVLKIADMGLSTATELGRLRLLSPMRQTSWWRAPELLLRLSDYFLSADMWSAGVILVEMLGQKNIFAIAERQNDIKILMKQFQVLGSPSPRSQHRWLKCTGFFAAVCSSYALYGSPPHSVVDGRLGLTGKSQVLKDLVYGCLTFDPDERWNAHDALSRLTGMAIGTPTTHENATRMAVEPLQLRLNKRQKMLTEEDLIANEELGNLTE